MPTQALERIEQMRGMEDLKSLAHRLARVAENKKNLPLARIQLPNYLFLEAPGCGVTTHIRMITELLQELRLIPFDGERKYFEWVLDASAFEPSGSFDRLLDEINRMAGFRSRFRGVVGLEIDAWQTNPSHHAFTRLTDLVDDTIGQILYIFVVEQRPGADPGELIRRLMAAMPLEVVPCPLPSAGDMALYLRDFLLHRRFAVSSEAMARLEALTPRLIATRAFDGFQTLDNLADEIVYHHCADAEKADACIGAGSLAFIDAPDGFLDRLREAAPGRHIGFRTGGERDAE